MNLLCLLRERLGGTSPYREQGKRPGRREAFWTAPALWRFGAGESRLGVVDGLTRQQP
ncbi:MAG: hypothetical protein J0M24_27630 [Verrucomicrobia bacterium]|nr:hypothetical protein [Verrucomicrobiota bacterium]